MRAAVCLFVWRWNSYWHMRLNISYHAKHLHKLRFVLSLSLSLYPPPFVQFRSYHTSLGRFVIVDGIQFVCILCAFFFAPPRASTAKRCRNEEVAQGMLKWKARELQREWNMTRRHDWSSQRTFHNNFVFHATAEKRMMKHSPNKSVSVSECLPLLVHQNQRWTISKGNTQQQEQTASEWNETQNKNQHFGWRHENTQIWRCDIVETRDERRTQGERDERWWMTGGEKWVRGVWWVEKGNND